MDDLMALTILTIGILIGIPLGWWLAVDGRYRLARLIDRLERAGGR